MNIIVTANYEIKNTTGVGIKFMNNTMAQTKTISTNNQNTIFRRL